MIKWQASIQRDCYGIIAIYQRELAYIVGWLYGSAEMKCVIYTIHAWCACSTLIRNYVS